MWSAITVLLAIFSARSVVAASAASGTFNILSMNVAGLPAILNGNGEEGDKTTNTNLIGQNMAKIGYDLIHVQEDFNYHAALYDADTHPYRTATSGGVPFGSGLNTLSNSDWIDFSRTKWATCSDASESDCLTPKGFTFMRWRVDEGVYIDAINLHADAGTEDGDNVARSANLDQVRDFIAANSAGNAVLVFGDTNSRYTRAVDTGIRDLVADQGMTDAWVKHARGGSPPPAGADAILCPEGVPANISCETVDKVFFRGSKLLDLQSTDFFYDTDRFLSENGTLLTDHNPVRVEFSWTLADNLRQSDLFGGPHGTYFNDLPSLPDSPKVSSVTLRGGNRLDSIAFTLTSGATLTHGGDGGDATSLTLANGESITAATLCQAQYNSHTRIFYAKLTTSGGQTVDAGKTTDDCTSVSAPEGFGIVGAYGQDGDEVDQLGWIFGRQ
ncbi:mannose-binding lectin [Schizophyllum commune Tattone D]|nr:mannose-binding lectin [Schizophyllum commune Tattone D]